jgi:hypothetical protein
MFLRSWVTLQLQETCTELALGVTCTVLLQHPPKVEMATRGGKKFNCKDVYAELARQNKKGTVEDVIITPYML